MKHKTIIFFISTILLLGMGYRPNIRMQEDKNEKKVVITDILGFWDTVSGYEAENIEFQREDDGSLIYHSYVNTRPWDNGNWSFKNGVLKLESDAGNTSTYTVEKDGDGLKLIDKNGSTAIFKREPGKVSNNADIIINIKAYLNKISAYTGLDNSEPIQTELRWNLESGEKVDLFGLSSEYPLNDIEKDDFQSLNEKLKEIGDYLAGLGFTQDVFNTTEIQSAYSDGSYGFLVKPDTEGTTNSITIEVGKLKD